MLMYLKRLVNMQMAGVLLFENIWASRYHDGCLNVYSSGVPKRFIMDELDTL